MRFLGRLGEMNIPVRLRHVVVPGITYDREELLALRRIAEGVKTLESVELLPYHTLGKAKYEKLGIPYPLADTPPLTAEELARAYAVVEGKSDIL